MRVTVKQPSKRSRLSVLGGDSSLASALHPHRAVRFGSSTATVRVGRQRQRYLSSPGGDFSLPGRWKLHLHQDDENVHIGPVIAIFTSSCRRGSKRLFAGLTGRFRRLVEEARAMGALAFVFTPSGLDWNKRVIRGFTYLRRGGRGRWAAGTFPFPNVVYNRVPTRRAENRPSVQKALDLLLAEPDLHVFNPKFLDKWEVYQALQDVDEVREHLPKTEPCEGVDQVVEFLREHGGVYLKMAGGSLGRGTARVDLTHMGQFRWKATRPGGHMATKVLRGFASLEQQLERLRRGRPYLVQQAIPLLRAKGRPFDVRALVQKDGSGEWGITGAAARVAGRGQITTHRPRGGSRAKLIPLLRSIFPGPQKAKRVIDDLREVILKAAKAFDEATGGQHGEVSMDVAIDKEGRPWVLEINSKPMVFDEPAIRRMARRRLLKYCFSQAGFRR